MKPLNGEKTHPLTVHARGKLADIALAPVPTCAVNAGVVNRLLREDLVEIQHLPSPFKTHRGGNCSHLVITDKGRATLATEVKECCDAENS